MAAIDSLITSMTRDEKLRLVHAGSKFGVPGVARLGIPDLEMSDGPHGVRQEFCKDSWEPAGRDDDFATYLPTGTAQAATWNVDILRAGGAVLGAEARDRGKDIILGPGFNIIRTPLCGRNFEYYSEDPLLSGQLAAAAIAGIQAQGVAACAKHFALNNQELDRHGNSVEVDERTLREIYLPAFKTAIEAGVLTVMGSYNKFFGQHCCHNERLVNGILKGEWAFAGAYISDWNGVHDCDEAVRFGMDIEMGTGVVWEQYHLAAPFRKGLEDGRFDEALLDNKVRRVLHVMDSIGMLADERPAGSRNNAAHQQVALDAAREAVVLLKNEDGILPLDANSLQCLVVIGDNATRKHSNGGNSSAVKTPFEITPLQGLRQLLGDQVEIIHEPGYPEDGAWASLPSEQLAIVDVGAGTRGWHARYYANRVFAGEAITAYAENPDFDHERLDLPAGISPMVFSLQLESEFIVPSDGDVEFGVVADGPVVVFIDDEEVLRVGGWQSLREENSHRRRCRAGERLRLRIEMVRSDNITGMHFGWRPAGSRMAAEGRKARALAAAKNADAVIFVGGLSHADDVEGKDRADLRLPQAQDELIEELLALRPDTVLLMLAGSAYLMPWLARAKALVQGWYAGMQGGLAMAEIIFGEVNPSGKLPMSFPARLADCPVHQHPERYGDKRSVYSEAWRIGYRDAVSGGATPLFAFGHGLSYSSFEYGDESLTSDEDGWPLISCTVVNSGERAGKEVVQIYIEACDRPLAGPRYELKGFTKLDLPVAGDGVVDFGIQWEDLAYFDEASAAWVVAPGRYIAHIGSASDDIRVQVPFEISSSQAASQGG